jgi:hypothetical protein
MGDAYDDGWEHAEANSLGCWQHAIEAIREKKEREQAPIDKNLNNPSPDDILKP